MVVTVRQMLASVSENGLRHFLLLIMCACSVRCAPAQSVTLPGATAQCNAQNRDPCATFPDLCSAGGGRCVVKGACEYQCVCPPDGRIGRDCSSNVNPEPGSVVDTLLVFPKDIFLDVNHVAKPNHFIGSSFLNLAATTPDGRDPTSRAQPTTLMWTDRTSSVQAPTTTSATSESTVLIINSTSSSNVVPPAPPFTETTTGTTTTIIINTTRDRSSPSSYAVLTETSPYPINQLLAKINFQNFSPRKEYKNQNAPNMKVTPSTVPSASSLVAETPTHYPHPLPENNEQPSLSLAPTGLPSTTPKKQIVEGVHFVGEMPPPLAIAIQTVNTARIKESRANSDTSIPFIPPVSHNGITPSPHTDPNPQITDHVTQPSPLLATDSSNLLADQNIRSLQVEGPVIVNSSQTEGSRTSITPNVQSSPRTSGTTALPDPTLTADRATTTGAQFLSSTGESGTSNQPIVTSPAPNNRLSTVPIGAEEFPTLFKVTLDNSLSQPGPGVNSPLSMVVHRVFVPIEQFQTVLRSGQR